jgi:hypothetical protein
MACPPKAANGQGIGKNQLLKKSDTKIHGSINLASLYDKK